MLGSMIWSSREGRKVFGGIAQMNQENLQFLRTLAETGRKRGNVVIALD
jgi:hypothetical protein